MHVPDNLDRLLERDRDLLVEWERNDSDVTAGSPSLLCQTAIFAAYPTAASAYYFCHPVDLLGTEVEGAAGVPTVSAAGFCALNVGTAKPPVGTLVVATFVDGGRWVFRYDG